MSAADKYDTLHRGQKKGLENHEEQEHQRKETAMRKQGKARQGESGEHYYYQLPP
jgi:hypothetical protein